MMKFQFEKYGFVDKGVVEIADLTLICGPNNVSKTYLSYSIYGFIRQFRSLVDLSLLPEQINRLKNEGSLNIDLSYYQQNLPNYIERASKAFSKTLEDYFSTPDDFFEQAKVAFSYDNFCIDLSGEFQKTVKFGQSEALIFDKAPNETTLSVAFQVTGKSKLPLRIINNIVGEAIAECLFTDMLPQPFVVTSERTGIVLFYIELDMSKNALLKQLSDKPNPIALLNSMSSRYARPIHDNIDVVRDSSSLSKRKSFIQKNKQKYQPVLDILQELLSGSFKTVDGQIFYQPREEHERDKVIVPIYIASSATKSLFLIDLYVNCLAEKQGLLVIDEPELNLHPDNQRKMASLLARLVNAGIKVLITTHSDYLIRELNNRIMLHNHLKNKESILKTENLVEQDILRPEQVKAFTLTTDHLIKEVSVDRYGINMEIFDDIIADANALADDIYYTIEE